MLRRALTVAAWAVGLDAAISTLSSLVRVVAKYGWRVAPSMALAASVTILLPLLLILFLVALLRELAGKASAGKRQLYAFAAMTGEVLKLLFVLGTARQFLPYFPAQYWSEVIGLRILPSLFWIALLWMFWKKADPLGSKRTRTLAGILCALEVVRGLRGAYGMATRLSRAVAPLNWGVWDFVTPVVSVAAWVSLAVVLFAIYRQDGLAESREGSSGNPGH